MPDVRGHNEGCITQRPNGKKYAVVSMDGRRVTSRACQHVHRPEDRHKDCPEARASLRALLLLRDRGREALDGSRMTLGSFLERWLDDVKGRLAPATWRKHEQHCRLAIAPALGHVRMSELSVGHVRRFLNDRTRTGPLRERAAGDTRVDPQTVRHYRATLRRALADAQREGLVTRNVAALAEPPPLPHRERSILTAAQARTLIEGTRDDRLHALWVLLVTTGLREAEALGLTWEDVNLGEASADRRLLEGHQSVLHDVRPPAAAGRRGLVPQPAGASGPPLSASVTVRHTLHRIDGEWQLRDPKTPKSRRTVILPAITADALRAHRTAQLEERMAAGRPTVEGLVFVRPDGRPYHGSKLTTLLYPVLERLGLPKVSVHDLRHSAATVLYGAGVPLESIADMLGHSTVRVTQDLYRHRVEQMQQDAADAMQRALG